MPIGIKRIRKLKRQSSLRKHNHVSVTSRQTKVESHEQIQVIRSIRSKIRDIKKNSDYYK